MNRFRLIGCQPIKLRNSTSHRYQSKEYAPNKHYALSRNRQQVQIVVPMPMNSRTHKLRTFHRVQIKHLPKMIIREVNVDYCSNKTNTKWKRTGSEPLQRKGRRDMANVDDQSWFGSSMTFYSGEALLINQRHVFALSRCGYSPVANHRMTENRHNEAPQNYLPLTIGAVSFRLT